MSKRFSVTLKNDLDSKLEGYLDAVKIDLSKSQLAALAIEEYISKPHTIELKPITDESWDNAAAAVLNNHSKAIKELG